MSHNTKYVTKVNIKSGNRRREETTRRDVFFNRRKRIRRVRDIGDEKMGLDSLSLPEAAGKLDDWLNGRSGSFVKALFDAMSKADPGNLDRLEKAFPNLVYAFKLWRGDVPSVTQLSILSKEGTPNA